MNGTLLVAVVLLPIFLAMPISLIRWKQDTHWMLYAEGVVLLTSALAYYALANSDRQMHVLFRFANDLEIAFCIDGLATVFAALVSFLWPLATLYAVEYMNHLEHRRLFFMFYVMTFGFSGHCLSYCHSCLSFRGNDSDRRIPPLVLPGE